LTRIREERQFILFCFLTDILLFWIALNLATVTRLHTLMYISLWRLQMDRVVCVVLFTIGAVIARSYDLSRLGDAFDAVYYAWVGLVFTGVMEMAAVSLVPAEWRAISRRELLIGLLVAAVFLGLWRSYAAGLLSRFASLRRFFYVLGNEAEGRRIAKALTESQGGCIDAEYVTFENLVARSESLKTSHGMNEAVIALVGEGRDERLDVLSYCEEQFRRVFLYPSLQDTRLFRHGNVHAIGGIPLIELAATVNPTPYSYVKRLIDIVVAAAGLLLTLPISILTAMAIKWTSPGGVLYSQERIGKDGRVFRLYKFRSMIDRKSVV
jgi:hypothetical protein